MKSLDALDRRIIQVVQVDSSLSAAELAERCGTTESTALRRLKAMRKDGTLAPPRMQVAGDKVGRGLRIILSIRLEKETPSEIEEFRRRLAAHPDVTDLYFVTGNWDYVLILSIARMEDYERFLDEMIVGQRAVVATETQVVITPMKVGAPLPVRDGP